MVRVCAVICVEFEHRDGFKEQKVAQNPLVTFTSVVQAAIPNGQLVAEGRGMHRSIEGAVEAISRSATLDVRASSKKGHGPQEYTTLSNDSFLKTANCVELHTMSELDDATLMRCCSDMTELPIAKKSGEFEASCEMLEFDADIAGLMDVSVWGRVAQNSHEKQHQERQKMKDLQQLAAMGFRHVLSSQVLLRLQIPGRRWRRLPPNPLLLWPLLQLRC